jgi:RecA/RadA recombinase
MKNNLLDRILKNSPTKHASILSESEFFKDKDVIPTDLPILNIAFSGSLDGGLCSGLTVLAGQSKSFKTLLALFCVKAYLDKYPDAVGVLYDSEGGITPEYLDSNGIDPTRVIHIPIEHLEMLKYDMVKTLKEIDRKDKVIMMIDSIGNTASLKELEDAENEKSVAEMQRAKNMKALFRMITPSLIAKDVPCIAIAHTYQTMELYSKAVISGGTGIMYAANQAFIITKAQEKDADGLAGWKFTINIEKSRFVKEKSKLPFTVLYNKGVQKWSSLFDLALESGHLIKPKMGWYQMVDMETGEIFEKNYRAKDIESNDEFFEKLIKDPTFKKFVEHKFKLSGGVMSVDEDVDISED